MRRLLWILPVVVISLWIAGRTEAQNSAFRPVDCPFEVPKEQIGTIDCGMLTVLENRRLGESSTIELAVAILRSMAEDPAEDPLIYLEGGPGSSALARIREWYDSPLRVERDIILLDQRGTGYSQPTLNCTELENPDVYRRRRLALDACHARLQKEGIDLSAYNSMENAADVEALRRALGYKQVNLYGVSYGSRLALTIMRDHSVGLRSVVLDSVYPLSVNRYDEQIIHGNRAFSVLFADCAADEKCSTAYPNLERRFYGLVERLNRAPQTVVDPEGFRHFMTGAELINLLYGELYYTDVLSYLPSALNAAVNGDFQPFLRLVYYGPLITDEGIQAVIDVILEAEPALEQLSHEELVELEQLLERGDFDAIRILLGDLYDEVDFFAIAAALDAFAEEWDSSQIYDAELRALAESEGMYFSIECNEEIPFNNLDKLNFFTDTADIPSGLRDGLYLGMEQQFQFCDRWESGIAAELENAPVRSEVPTLILTGEYDPITPPDWGRLVAKRLPNSTFVEVPATGHGVLDTRECPMQVVNAFLQDPQTPLDTSCVAEIDIQFVVQ